jgi:hypothetical protein
MLPLQQFKQLIHNKTIKSVLLKLKGKFKMKHPNRLYIPYHLQELQYLLPFGLSLLLELL